MHTKVQRQKQAFPKSNHLGEEDIETAFRELEEETGLRREHVRYLDEFKYETTYSSTSSRFGNIVVEKKLVIFACVLKGPQSILIEDGHHGYYWAVMDFDAKHRFPITEVLDTFRKFLLQKPTALKNPVAPKGLTSFDISIPVSSSLNLDAFSIPQPQFKPIQSGSFVGNE